MEIYHKLLNAVQDAQQDAEKFYMKGNITAGIRLRQKMQEVKRLSQELRNQVQEFRKENI